MENRSGLCVLFEITPAVGVTENEMALAQVRELRDREFVPKTVGADKGYHTRDFVGGCRALGVVPQVAEVKDRQVAGFDGRTKKKGYETSQRIRKRIEEIFGWVKTTGGFRKTRYRGVERTTSAGKWLWRPTTYCASRSFSFKR